MLTLRMTQMAMLMAFFVACSAPLPPVVCDAVPLDAGQNTIVLQPNRRAPTDCGFDGLGTGVGGAIALSERSHVEIVAPGCNAVSMTSSSCGSVPLSCDALTGFALFRSPYVEGIFEPGSYQVMFFDPVSNDGGPREVTYHRHRIVEGNETCATAARLTGGDSIFSRVGGALASAPSACEKPDGGVSAFFETSLSEAGQLSVGTRDAMHVSVRAGACDGPEVACAVGQPNCFFCSRDQITSSLTRSLDAGRYFITVTSTRNGATAFEGTGFLLGIGTR